MFHDVVVVAVVVVVVSVVVILVAGVAVLTVRGPATNWRADPQLVARSGHRAPPRPGGQLRVTRM